MRASSVPFRNSVLTPSLVVRSAPLSWPKVGTHDSPERVSTTSLSLSVPSNSAPGVVHSRSRSASVPTGEPPAVSVDSASWPLRSVSVPISVLASE